MMTVLRSNKGTFQAMQKAQSSANRGAAMASCSTICQPYSVPGGGTPCGTKCIMYCVGK